MIYDKMVNYEVCNRILRKKAIKLLERKYFYIGENMFYKDFGEFTIVLNDKEGDNFNKDNKICVYKSTEEIDKEEVEDEINWLIKKGIIEVRFNYSALRLSDE